MSWENHSFPHPAIRVDAENLQGLATVGATLGAGMAVAAVQIRLDATAVTRIQMPHLRADGEDLDAEFMSEDSRELDEGHLAQVTAEVGAADADGFDRNESFA